jgi:putative transposase
VDNPRYYRKAERDLKKAQRCVSRLKKGSQRWRKAVHHCAKKHHTLTLRRGYSPADAQTTLGPVAHVSA